MPNRRGRAFSYRPNRNPHNPNERMVRPNGKHYYPRSAIRSVLYYSDPNEDRHPGDGRWYVVVFQTQDEQTARNIVKFQLPNVKISNPRPDWVSEHIFPVRDFRPNGAYQLSFDRPVHGKAAVIFDAEPPDEV